MFNLGLPEMLVIGCAALLLFGPKRMPELARSMGKAIRDFKKAVNGEEESESTTATHDDPAPQIKPPVGEPLPHEQQTTASKDTAKVK
jgi:sec-independent protein translocase protein TatA